MVRPSGALRRVRERVERGRERSQERADAVRERAGDVADRARADARRVDRAVFGRTAAVEQEARDTAREVRQLGATVGVTRSNVDRARDAAATASERVEPVGDAAVALEREFQTGDAEAAVLDDLAVGERERGVTGDDPLDDLGATDVGLFESGTGDSGASDPTEPVVDGDDMGL